MHPKTSEEQKILLSEIIKKEINVLGPNIALLKARKVKELTVTDDGIVTKIEGDGQEITNKLIQQFSELSSSIVEKTINPILYSPPAQPVQDTKEIKQEVN